MRAFPLALILAFTASLPAYAVEVVLVYVHERGCPYCRLWDERLAPLYPRTSEGKRAPLRPVEKSALAQFPFKLERPVRYTPTFILVSEDREVGRIEGYPGEDFFWPMLARLLDRLPPAAGYAGR